MPLELKLIRTELLDPPVVNMRVHVDDDDLAGLAASIRDTGLIYPVCVYAEGGRFRIAAGYRRYLAHKMLGREEVLCRDYTGSNIPPEQIKAHENLFQSKPNDAELMQWMIEEQERQPRTLDELKRMTGKSEHWINTRMAIQRGDKEVFDAMLAGKITLAQAEELNKFPDEYRHTYLQNVMESTPPAHIIANWRRDINLMLSHQTPGAQVPPPVPVQDLPGIAEVPHCVLCDNPAHPWDSELFTAHKLCMRGVVSQIRGGQ